MPDRAWPPYFRARPGVPDAIRLYLRIEAKKEASLSSTAFVFLTCAGRKAAGRVAGSNRPGSTRGGLCWRRVGRPFGHGLPCRLCQSLSAWEKIGVERFMEHDRGAAMPPLQKLPDVWPQIHIAVPRKNRAAETAQRQAIQLVINKGDRLDQRGHAGVVGSIKLDRILGAELRGFGDGKKSDMNGSTREPSEDVPREREPDCPHRSCARSSHRAHAPWCCAGD